MNGVATPPLWVSLVVRAALIALVVMALARLVGAARLATGCTATRVPIGNATRGVLRI
jgi:hypothetical protein